MKFSLSWLKQHLETESTATELADAMVRLGIEVEGLEEGSNLNRVVIGKILSREQHPEADRLGVCMVEVGEDEPRQIVCGAPNARADLTVAVALDGACLPGDFKIKKSKLRGVTSNGMLCAKDELGLGDNPQEGGIWELDTDAAVGSPLADVLGAGDVVFDVSITPNRGDVLSVYGIARDLAAAGMGEFHSVAVEDVEDADEEMEETDSSDVVLEHEGCTYFTGQIIEGVKNGESPDWLKKYLEQADLRPINAIADITNYMMLSYGQPMHAYDADKLKGSLKVAPAKGGEKLEGLDGLTHELSAGDIAIMDDSGVIGLGGIVGGESTSVDENTTRVFLEAAHFNKSNIAKTGQRLQCNTDARYRFERGIDPSITDVAAFLTADLIEEVCGGEMQGMETVGVELPEARVIDFDPAKVKTFGGLDMDANEVKSILETLGFKVDGAEMFKVEVPHHFTIMNTPEDLVEEVLRLKGYDEVPTLLPSVPLKGLSHAKGLRADRVARRALSSMGYLEALNYSFIDEEQAAMFAEGAELQTLENPIDEEGMSTMRPSLLPGLLNAAATNMARGENFVQMAEVGKVFTAEKETLFAAGLLCGKEDRHWQGSSNEVDAFDAKRDALALLESLGVNGANLQVREGFPSYYHPGRSAQLGLGRNVFGYFGELHPGIAKKMGLKGRVVIFEINLEQAESLKMKKSQFMSSQYQAVSRDFAFLVDEAVKAADVLQCLKSADKELVKSANLFDVYTGEGVPEGKKSLALSFTLQATDRTLTDKEINAVAQKATDNVLKKCGGEVR